LLIQIINQRICIVLRKNENKPFLLKQTCLDVKWTTNTTNTDFESVSVVSTSCFCNRARNKEVISKAANLEHTELAFSFQIIQNIQ
jgi:hypothetical protein